MRRLPVRIARAAVVVAGLSATTLYVSSAEAQQPPPGGAPTTAPTEDKMAEARQRYNRGLQLYSEANYDAARVEFERAYQLAPSYKILYNIGLAYEQLGDYVQALTILERYLQQGGNEITDERRNEVIKELAQLKPRIARVTLRVSVDKAEVFVDDTCSVDARTTFTNCGPLEGDNRVVLMNPGRRRITVRRDGYYPENTVITVAGSDVIEHTITLKPVPVAPKEKKKNPWVIPTIVGWGVTAAGLITAGVAGGLALGAENDKQAATDQFGAQRSNLDEERDKVKTLALVSDVAWVSSAVVAGVSAYFTIRMLGWKGESGDVNVQVGANRIGIGGHF